MGRYAGYARTGSGSYTPTATAVANVAEVVMKPANFIRIGDVVQVSGEFDLTSTLAVSTPTRFRISLPDVSSDINADDLAGICSAGVVAAATPGRIREDITGTAARVELLSLHTNLQTYTYVLMYVVR